MKPLDYDLANFLFGIIENVFFIITSLPVLITINIFTINGYVKLTKTLQRTDD